MEQDPTVKVREQEEEKATALNKFKELKVPQQKVLIISEGSDTMFVESNRDLEKRLRKQIIHEFKETINCKQRLIYFAHAFGGDIANIKDLEDYIHAYIKKNPDIMIVSPLHMMGFLYGRISEDKANEDCLSWLTLCEKMVVCGEWTDKSFVNAEIKFAEENGIPIEYLN